eukprot:TRINITY_DN4047_c0_g1_i1.p1 TRINITY_DN4047_c0_g1~~TRINITY_DN4047_c0_g1_i1.p1  ORF type:complete len:108 (-),score=4.29 TRINITY_DN4047_c0_g1_i1:240-563(-)
MHVVIDIKFLLFLLFLLFWYWLDVEIVSLLIRQKADLNVKDNFGSTALMIASFNSNKEICELLIRNKADHLIKNNHHQDALDSAEYGIDHHHSSDSVMRKRVVIMRK